MLLRSLIIIILLSNMQDVLAQSFFGKMKRNLSNAMQGSHFQCTKYERQSYEMDVLRNPNTFMPFTEFKPKMKKCVKWIKGGKGAVNMRCEKYEHKEYSESEHKRLYKTVTKERTVCVDGYTVN